MTGGPVLPELGIRLFRALYDAYDLIAVDGVSIAVPKDGTIPVFTGATLTEIAWQISEHASGGGGAGERAPGADVPGLQDDGPPAGDDVHPGAGSRGGRRGGLPSLPPADCCLRRAAVPGEAGRPGARRRAMRYREDTPAEQARARAAVAAWRGQNPAGTAEELVGAIGGQFHPDYAVVLRGFFFAAEQVTGIAAQDAGTGR